MHKKNTLLTYSLSLIIVPSIIGMQLVKKPDRFKKNFIRTVIAKSPELDAMRKTWRVNNSPQEVVDISQGKIKIKEEIPLGKRYGTCHNYAFTKTMGIVGQAPKILNILGQTDYYGDDYLKAFNFFDILEPNAVLKPGDLAIYLKQNEKGLKEITHTGIVVSDDCIESKWGLIKGIFEHPIWYVPECFGDHCRYLRLKINGDNLLVKIQKRLQQKQVKKRYDILARRAQQELFGHIKQYAQDKNINHGREIYQLLEYNMNVHLDVPDENGVTPLMHADNIGCEMLKEMFEIYQAHRE